ncbi:MAG: glycosyltransferase family 4 protein [Ardenticatenia bacterium]|nr:glycosyltransferase family 4 protein [Ardenticatenia bacterium]
MSPRCTVLFLNHTALLGGGAETVLMQIVATLDRQRFRPVIALPSGTLMDVLSGQADTLVEEVRFIGLTRTFNPLRLFVYCLHLVKCTLSLIRVIRRHSPDVIYANSYYSGILGILAGKFVRLPVVWHVHDIYPPNVFSRTAVPLLGRLCARMIAISGAVKENLQSYRVSSHKIRLVHNGVDTAAYDQIDAATGERVRRELGISGHRHVVGTIGQPVPRKRLEDFVQAAALVLERFPDVVFVVVGQPISAGGVRYEQKVKKLLDDMGSWDHFVFTGFRPDIPEILSAFDLFILASEEEPFGLVIIEAMAAAKPVVATRVGGIPEILEDGMAGVLVPPRRPRALAEAIITLLEDEVKAQAMGREGRRVVGERFSVWAQVRSIEAVLLESLGAGAG